MMNQKAILLVGNFLSQHGINPQVCETMAVYLQKSGWSVVTTSRRYNRAARLADMLVTAWRFRRQYYIAHIDVFSGASFVWAEAVCWLLRRLNKPVVLTLRGGNLPAFATQAPRRVRRLLGSADAVVGLSKYLIEQMRPYRADIHYIPNPIPLVNYRYHPRAAARPVLVWLRAFHQIYNPVMAVDVVCRLKTIFPDAQLIMVGPDKDGSLAQVNARITQTGLSEQVTLPGRVEKSAISGWLNKGDVFINTSDFDNTPVSVIEAMACGLCVVSTDTGGMPYLIENGVDGLLVPPGDADAMAGAVRRVCENPALAARLSTNARSKAAAFDWDTLVQDWDALLTSVQR